MSLDLQAIELLGRTLLEEIGEDPDRPGLRDTPRRWAKAWAEFIEYDPGELGTAFEAVVDEMVVVTGIESWTMCEHHLLPVKIVATIGYLPHGRVLGLSKFARIVHARCHALTVQEELTTAIAKDVVALTGSGSVAVYVRGEHLCMTTRGARTKGDLHTSVLWGAYRDKPEARAEFFALARERGVNR